MCVNYIRQEQLQQQTERMTLGPLGEGTTAPPHLGRRRDKSSPSQEKLLKPKRVTRVGKRGVVKAVQVQGDGSSLGSARGNQAVGISERARVEDVLCETRRQVHLSDQDET